MTNEQCQEGLVSVLPCPLLPRALPTRVNRTFVYDMCGDRRPRLTSKSREYVSGAAAVAAGLLLDYFGLGARR